MTRTEKILMASTSIILMLLIWMLFDRSNLSESLSDFQRRDSISMGTISELRYQVDTLLVNDAWYLGKIAEQEEKFEKIANDYLTKTNEEHHLKIITAPDTLSSEYLRSLGTKYGLYTDVD